MATRRLWLMGVCIIQLQYKCVVVRRTGREYEKWTGGQVSGYESTGYSSCKLKSRGIRVIMYQGYERTGCVSCGFESRD